MFSKPRAEQVVGVGSLQLLRLHSPPPLQASGADKLIRSTTGNRPSQIASLLRAIGSHLAQKRKKQIPHCRTNPRPPSLSLWPRAIATMHLA